MTTVLAAQLVPLPVCRLQRWWTGTTCTHSQPSIGAAIGPSPPPPIPIRGLPRKLTCPAYPVWEMTELLAVLEVCRQGLGGEQCRRVSQVTLSVNDKVHTLKSSSKPSIWEAISVEVGRLLAVASWASLAGVGTLACIIHARLLRLQCLTLARREAMHHAVEFRLVATFC